MPTEQIKYFKSQNIDICYYGIVPDEMSQKELKNMLREKAKINAPEYDITIDNVLTVLQLLKIINSNCPVISISLSGCHRLCCHYVFS